MEKIYIHDFKNDFKNCLPDTYQFMKEGKLFIYDFIYQINLDGSRGLKKTCRENSDIDIALLADINLLNGFSKEEQGKIFHELLAKIEAEWEGPIEIDPAIFFDVHHCKLKCFDRNEYKTNICQGSGIDCCGVYKINRGFTGFVENFGVEIKKMYPTMTIWRRS